MEKVIGLITCNYSAKSPSALVENRPVASMPFLGRYRLVDFPLSNMVNAGLRTVGMVMPGSGPQERWPLHPAWLRVWHLSHRCALPPS